ncbi:MAG TPA: flagellar hook-associated family protein [Hyphomicrobiaceae bacterium]|nr:flagellar hook-associated family protein [Hyphomicrobiaceae bacterium]
MKTTSISTQAISDATRLSLSKLQLQLSTLQKEVTSGRLADVGQTLGHNTGQTISLRQERDRLATIIDTNGVVSGRLKSTQTTLEALNDSAQSFINTLLVARSSSASSQVAIAEARTKLTALAGTMNTNVGGAYIYAGINSDVKPLTDYFETPAPANQLAVANAFVTDFGVAQSAPGTELITGANMQTFLDTTFAALFDPAAWATTWSAASDQNMRSRIATSELVETSTNANVDAVRKLASAFTMIADLGIDTLNQDAYLAVIDTAIRAAGEAVGEITQLRGQLGAVEERVVKANDQMQLQIDIMDRHINLLEAVDPAEASTRISLLLTQIETAYSLTARIQRLSLLNYL